MDVTSDSLSAKQRAFPSLYSTAFLLLLLTILLTLLSANRAQASSVTLQWDPVTSDPEVTHYEVCYGLSSGTYGSPCVVADARGSATDTQTISGLTERSTYYFAVRSANHAPGVYSAFSNEVSTTIPGLDSVSVAPTAASVRQGSTHQFTAVASYSDGKTQDVSSQVLWTSTSTAVATINAAGLATTVGTGTTTIRATLSGLVGSASLTVQAASGPTLTSIALSPSSSTIQEGEAWQFTANGSYSDGTSQNISGQVAWLSTSNAVATISESGLATATGAGTTTIKASLGGVTGNATLTVQAKPAPVLTSIALSPASSTIQVGSTQQYTATGTYSDGKTQNVTSQVAWTSTSSAVATVGASGLATAIGIGSTNLRATLGAVSGNANLTVQASPLVVTTTTPPGAISGASYSTSLSATGGTPPYSWSVASGSLPAGLALNSATGTISGTPTKEASYAFTMRVTDSGNPSQSASKSLSIVVAASAPITIWPAEATPRISADSDTNAVELGVKFKSDVSGTIMGIRFYKASSNTGTHVGNLWTSDGTRLATITFNNETNSGWQQADFATPVGIEADTIYVASYHAPNGRYAGDNGYFDGAGVDNSPLHALASKADSGNGVYRYGSGGFPTETWNASNYWVDVVFVPGSPAALASIQVTPESSTLDVGATQAFVATGTYTDGRTQNITEQITWASADTSVATVGSSGVATAVGAGTTTISAKLGDIHGGAELTVQAAAAPVAEFTADPTSGTVPLTVNFTDASSGDIVRRIWDFGDGGTSEAEHAAVYTYKTPGTYTVRLTVTGPDGASDEEIKTNLIAVSDAAPHADFTATPTSGTAPLPVAFTDSSSGMISTRLWDFGDGTSSSGENPKHSYSVAGSYTATLTVTGPGGSDSKAIGIVVKGGAVEPTIEVGELRVDHIWQWVEFQHPFQDPVVVANGLSHEGSDPVTVRITDVTPAFEDSPGGFWIFLQEWEYLDGSHSEETVSYMVMERGHRILPDGTHVEAGTTDTSKTNSFGLVTFEEPFAVVPVVFSAVTSTNEADAVVTRIRRVGTDEFQLGMDEQEANRAAHLSETIAYIAWEPSAGTVDGVDFEVGRTDDSVTHKPFVIAFATPFVDPPMLLADMQTTDGGDTANLRWQSRTSNNVEVWVDEEQSKGSETNHTTEVVGYAVFEVIE